MKNIAHPNPVDVVSFDQLLREALTDTLIGVSTGPYGTVVHLQPIATTLEQIQVNNSLNNYNTLTLSYNPATRIVRCDDAAISGDGDVGFVVKRNDSIEDMGIEPLVAGTIELELPDVVGRYDIFIYRRHGNFASGLITMEVS